MIPWLLKIHIGDHHKKHRRIWIPLPLIYILLLALIIILAPLLIIGAIVLLLGKGINMFKVIPVLLSLLTSSSGFFIDVSSQKAKFEIAIK